MAFNLQRDHAVPEVPLPEPHSAEALRRDLVEEAFGPVYVRGARVRIGLIALVLLGIMVVQAATDTHSWRLRFAALVIVGITPLAVFDLARSRRAGFRLGAGIVPMGLPVVAILQFCVLFATGGIESPFLPMLPMFTVVMALALGEHRGVPLLVLASATGIWFLTLGELYGWLPDINPSIFGGGDRAGHNDVHLLTTAAFATFLMVMAAIGGRAVRSRFDQIVLRALDARDDELAAHTAHARDLNLMTAEIAHELKNPLAGIKLLAALVAKDVDGKTGERVGVLRQEVDRMQAILDEFLNFSRPLVPLSMVEADLAELCADVVALHEGIARDRDVTLAISGDAPVWVRGDPRKLRQVLINLVQNAIDASPPRTHVEIAPRANGADAIVEVRDRGPGIAVSVADRAWEPGVTTKETGSGLGLPVARALCRQHGGDVDLVARPDGGTTAVVRIPAGRAS